MSQFDQQWQKLTALARQAPAGPDAVPFGFATRLAAQAAQSSAPGLSLERFALRGLFLAAVCSVAAVALNFAEVSSEQADTYATGATDTLVELLDIS